MEERQGKLCHDVLKNGKIKKRVKVMKKKKEACKDCKKKNS